MFLDHDIVSFFPIQYSRCSMYGIFTYISPKLMVNVGKYSIHGSYGYSRNVPTEWTFYDQKKRPTYGKGCRPLRPKRHSQSRFEWPSPPLLQHQRALDTLSFGKAQTREVCPTKTANIWLYTLTCGAHGQIEIGKTNENTMIYTVYTTNI